MGCGISKGPYPAPIPISSPLPPGVEPIDAAGAQDPDLLWEVIACCARSFAGTPNEAPPREFDWMLGAELSDRNDPTGARFELMRACLGYCVHYALVLGSRGLILAAKSDDSAWCPDETQGETGESKTNTKKKSKKIVGVAILYLYPKGWPAEGTCAQMKTFMAASEKWTKAQKQFIECPRSKALDKTLSIMHKKHASSPHIYLPVLAVEPSSQGKGVGGKLLRAVHAIADAMQLPCYLECDSGKNEQVYQKKGYSTAGKESMACGKGAAAADTFEGSMCAMRREVEGSLHAVVKCG